MVYTKSVSDAHLSRLAINRVVHIEHEIVFINIIANISLYYFPDIFHFYSLLQVGLSCFVF